MMAMNTCGWLESRIGPLVHVVAFRTGRLAVVVTVLCFGDGV